MSDLLEAVQTLRERQDELIKAEQYYEGTQPEVFASAKLRRALAKTGTDFRLNFAKTPVDAVLNRLDVADIASPNTGANSIIKETFDFNELDIEMNEIHKRALIYGDAYVMVWPDEEGQIEITYNSPRTTHLFYDPEHPRRKRFAAKMWQTNDNKVRVNLYYADRIEKYIAPAKAKDPREFIPFVEEEGQWPLANPFGQVPVFHMRTERQYGRPEHFDAYAPQDMINKLVITQMASNDYHGFPQRYVLSGGGNSSEATDFNEESSDAVETSSLTSGPGELWWLTGEGLKVGQFQAAQVDTFLKPIQEYVRAIASVTATPFHFFDPHGEVPSGESLRVAEAPLNKKVKNRQKLFGSTWSEIFGFVLTLRNKSGEVNVQWNPPETMDSLDSWTTAKAKRDVGLPLKQVLVEAGYTEAQIAEFALEQAQESAEQDE